MQIFAGLGNPGPRHAGQRHNIGFMALDAIAEAHGAGPWRSKFRSDVAEATLGGEKVLLIKPATYMNRSGEAVGEAARFYKLTAGAVWVFHDELDLAPGKIRVKSGGGHAGHNGLRSLHAHLGADYNRVRLGIGHPGHKDRVTPHVLGDFAKADRDWLEPLLDAVAAAAPLLAEGKAERFMTAVAQKQAPVRARGPASAPDRAGSGGTSAADPPRAAMSKSGEQTGGGAGGADDAGDARSPLQRLVDRFR